MFKKLFISLLILSALAAEGIGSFPGNAYNYYLLAEYKLGMQNEQGTASEQLQGASANSGLSSRAAINGTFIFSAGSLEKFKSKAAPDAFKPVIERPLYACSISCSVVIPVGKPDKGIILGKSDISPPCYIA